MILLRRVWKLLHIEGDTDLQHHSVRLSVPTVLSAELPQGGLRAGPASTPLLWALTRGCLLLWGRFSWCWCSVLREPATHGEGLSLAGQSCMYFVHAREAGMALVLEHLASERMGRDLGQALFYRSDW